MRVLLGGPGLERIMTPGRTMHGAWFVAMSGLGDGPKMPRAKAATKAAKNSQRGAQQTDIPAVKSLKRSLQNPGPELRSRLKRKKTNNEPNATKTTIPWRLSSATQVFSGYSMTFRSTSGGQPDTCTSYRRDPK